MSEKDFGLVISDYDIGKGKDGQQLLEEARYTKSVKAVSSFVLLTAESSLDKVIGAIEPQNPKTPSDNWILMEEDLVEEIQTQTNS